MDESRKEMVLGRINKRISDLQDQIEEDEPIYGYSQHIGELWGEVKGLKKAERLIRGYE